MKYLCKETFNMDITSVSGSSAYYNDVMYLFSKEQWYDVSIHINGITIHGDPDISVDRFLFNKERFEEHFYSVDELREITIDKIIEQ